MQKYKVIGIMSGTSLDGLDMAYCVLNRTGRVWSYKIGPAVTIKYSKYWKQKLASAFTRSKKEIVQLDKEYGRFIGKQVALFIKAHELKPDLVCSHGHTVFHRPEKKFTLQIGDGTMISKFCGITVVNDFRSLDVRLGGQGAPLVPIGDKLLFPQYDACLNLGGFANISFEKNGKRIAFDICPVNIVLNELASMTGKEFDRDGRMAASGKINTGLLKKLNALPYYRQRSPKSLGREWVEKHFNPLLNGFQILIKDKLRTVAEHIAMQAASAMRHRSSVLTTGGGAFNKFLVKLIRKRSSCLMIVPDKKTIEFKEALVFALLGVLRVRSEINTLRSVTGAERDSCGGTISTP